MAAAERTCSDAAPVTVIGTHSDEVTLVVAGSVGSHVASSMLIAPALAAVKRCENSTSCARCWGTVDQNGVACSRCAAAYCSTTCQAQHWALHSAECRGLARLPSGSQAPATSRLVAQLVHAAQGEGYWKGHDLRAGDRLALWSGALLQPWTEHEQGAQLHSLLAAPVSTHRDMLLASAAFKLLAARKSKSLSSIPVKAVADACSGVQGRVCRNGHSIVDEELRELGIGLFPLGSLLDHSCDPNTFVVYTIDKSLPLPCPVLQRVVAGRTLSHREPLTISYVSASAGVLAARKSLKDEYSFDCSCTRCMVDVAALVEGIVGPQDWPRVWLEYCAPCCAWGADCPGLRVPTMTSAAGQCDPWQALAQASTGKAADMAQWVCRSCGAAGSPPSGLVAAWREDQVQTLPQAQDMLVRSTPHAPTPATRALVPPQPAPRWDWVSPCHPAMLQRSERMASALLAEEKLEEACQWAALHCLGTLGTGPLSTPLPAVTLLTTSKLLAAGGAQGAAKCAAEAALKGSGGGLLDHLGPLLKCGSFALQGLQFLEEALWPRLGACGTPGGLRLLKAAKDLAQ